MDDFDNGNDDNEGRFDDDDYKNNNDDDDYDDNYDDDSDDYDDDDNEGAGRPSCGKWTNHLLVSAQERLPQEEQPHFCKTFCHLPKILHQILKNISSFLKIVGNFSNFFIYIKGIKDC